MSAQNINSLADTSHGFQLGFMKGGIFWGWPSSHTTTAFAMSTCLIAIYPQKKVLVSLALLYAIYVGLSVSVSIHWLSEFVAGAIIGSVIGRVVGTSFRVRLNCDGNEQIKKHRWLNC
jgi:membrane-associated phospholipid phosphatase